MTETRLENIKRWYPGASKDDLDWLIGQAERVERLERAVLLLAGHVGGTGWNRPLSEALHVLRWQEDEQRDRAE